MSRHSQRQQLVALAALASFVLVAAATGGAQTLPVTAADLSRSIEDISLLVNRSVVQIFTTSYAPAAGLVPRGGDLVTTERATGSGVILDPDGYIVTNAHVVRNARRVRVEIPVSQVGSSILSPRSRIVGGQIVAIDRETDLAVVKVDERNLPALLIADSDTLKTGQLVLAIGSPLGLHNSVSLGVVSAVARQLEPESPMIYVQTDASINPGSSGGPLVDMNGRLVGINTLIASQSGGNDGLGFAAPSNIVQSVFDQIRRTGRVRRGDIGVRAQTVTPVLAAGLGLTPSHGVVLSDVMPGSPAAKAGLRPGDLVVALDGKPMENGRQLQISLYRRTVGETVALDVARDGKVQTVRVAVVEREDPLADLAATVDVRHVPRLGILGVTLDRGIAARLPLRAQFGIVVVSTVAAGIDSPDGGFLPGDVIHGVNRTQVATLPELRAALDALKPGDPAVVQIERGGSLMFLALIIE